MPPAFGEQLLVRRAMFSAAFACQVPASLIIYHKWLVSSNINENASSPYLLSLICWFFLCESGTLADIESASGVPLREMCFGIGSFFALFTYGFILAGIHAGRTQAGSSASFLILAPPSLAGISIIGINGGYHKAAGALFGCVMGLFWLLVRMGPTILAPPRVLGTNWFYLFPQAAMAKLAITIAQHSESIAMTILALVLSVFATLSLVVVAIRMGIHGFQVIRGTDVWEDPLVAAASKKDEPTPVGEEGFKRKTPEASFTDTKSTNDTKGKNGTTVNAAATARAAHAAVAPTADPHEEDDDDIVIQSV